MCDEPLQISFVYLKNYHEIARVQWPVVPRKNEVVEFEGEREYLVEKVVYRERNDCLHDIVVYVVKL
jgi:hypothetical protein